MPAEGVGPVSRVLDTAKQNFLATLGDFERRAPF